MFKRFFIVTASKLGSFKQRLPKTISLLDIAKEQNGHLQTSVTELEQEKNFQQAKIDEQNRAIKLLLDKTKEFENQNEKQKSEISDLELEILNAQTSIKQSKITIQVQKMTITELENEKREYLMLLS